MDPTSSSLERAPIAVIGVPTDAGASERGAALGPAALRIAGLVDVISDLKHTVVDHGDIAIKSHSPPPALRPTPARAQRTTEPRNIAEIAAAVRALAEATRAVAERSEIPVVLGGDHSLAMGSISGVARHMAAIGQPLTVLWIDAHADFNTPATSPSGNLHGMPAAFLCGEPGFDAVMGAAPHPIIEHRNLILFGLRSVDRLERAVLAERGVRVIDMRVIDEVGVPVLMRQLLAEVAASKGRLYVSLDADVIDPSLAPGVGTPVPGGLTYREAHLVMEMLCDSGLVVGLDLVELNPFLDDRGKTAHLLVELAGSLFGRQIFYHSPLE